MNCEKHTSNCAQHEDGALTMSFQETSASICDLPFDLLKYCFSYISGSYITVAPVSRRFFSSYSTDDSDTVNSADTLLKIGKNKRTTADTVSSDLKLTEYCFTLDAPDKFMHKVCYKSIMKGRQDIVECGLIFGVDFEEV